MLHEVILDIRTHLQKRENIRECMMINADKHNFPFLHHIEHDNTTKL